MTECIAQLPLEFHPTLPITIAFDAPQISSDGGAILLRQMDDRLGLSKWLAALLPDERNPAKIQHGRREQVRQRLYQIALGYADCNDADRLRHDPVLKSVCDRTPQAAGLSSQPTLSRLENAVDGRTLRAVLVHLEEQYVISFAQPPEVIVLDIDSTDDPTHGQPQLSFFHGYYDQHRYHPLLIFDGASGQLVSAVLRPGNAHAARGAIGVLRRLIHRLKQRFPQVQIVVRGDSAFAVPRLLWLLEELDRELGGLAYVFGLAQNAVLLRQGATALAQAHERFATTRHPVQHFDAFAYAAESWPQERRVIMKAEVTAQGENPRFVVTSPEGFAPALLYHAYCERRQCENLIKDFKNALQADRLSCCTFAANFFRLLEHAAAYVLLHALRTHVAPLAPRLGRAQFDTLRLSLLKVAALDELLKTLSQDHSSRSRLPKHRIAAHRLEANITSETANSRKIKTFRGLAGVAYLWLEWLGHSGLDAARLLGLRPQTISEARQRAGGNRRRRIGSKSSKFSHNLHSRATSPSRQDGWLMPRRRWAGGIVRYRPLNSGGRFSIKAWADSRKSSVRCNPKPPV